jgi:TRAP-type C4-dicarboxylate transport system substrate-binding protein
MLSVRLAIAALVAVGLAAALPAAAQTTLTMSSWVSPQHHLTANVVQGWAAEVEKATNGRVKFTMLPKRRSSTPSPTRASTGSTSRRWASTRA